MTTDEEAKVDETEEETEEEEKDPIDDLLPRWIEFNRLGNPKEIQEAMVKFYSDENATADHFKQQFGIDLREFKNYYFESAVAEAPRGPFTPTRITPILVLRASRTGKSHSAHIFKHDGLMHESRMEAWIDREDWDKHVDDTFTEELKQKAAKIREQQKQEMQKNER